jgi:glutamate-1-semialdehyde 2,1-aminomutase
MISLFFTDQEVYDFDSAKTSDTALFGKYFNAMLENGVYIAPSQFESLFLSTSIDESLADKIIEANLASLKSL